MFNVSNSKHHRDNNIRHYESGFKPQEQDINYLRLSAISPTVFRQPTEAEYIELYTKQYNKKLNNHIQNSLDHTQSAVELRELYIKALPLDKYLRTRIKHSQDGYRAYNFVIGLEDAGYIDVDSTRPDTEGNTPTQNNLHEALKKANIYHIIFQSASAKDGKYRILYKRGYKLYLDGTYKTLTDEWNLQNPTSQNIKSTKSDFPFYMFPKLKLPQLIAQVIFQETMYIADVLAKEGINVSGIDLTACKAHMHSAHSIDTNRPLTDYAEPIMYTEGESL